ncbi:DUF6765 family protein [Candidatus Bandiella euplotis]|uniref:DUF6765 family protein n=1 Tax=Candidatus Bandiella euplotis TaxID=1664265 RepID=UPI002B262AD0|nr:DUF6765 family protein [Candidatus Bandiella woodruffii]
MHLYLCIPLILPFLTYLLLLHFLHSVFISLFSLLLAIFILASYLSYGNTPEHSINTTKNSKLARKILRCALKSRNLYCIGIASHVYVDTWAHQNFIGASSDFNALYSHLVGILPTIGHIDALDKPDLVGLIWQDPRLKKSKISNIRRFLDASKKLIHEYGRYTKKLNVGVEQFLSSLETIMYNDEKNSYLDVKRLQGKRIKQYNELAKQITSFDILKYNKHKWRDESIKLAEC